MASNKQEQAPGKSAPIIIKAFEASTNAHHALALAYEAAYLDVQADLSLRYVAEQVTDAGYPINKDTLNRYALAYTLTGAGIGEFLAACDVVWPGENKTGHGVIGRAIEAAKTPAVKKILSTYRVACLGAELENEDGTSAGFDPDMMAKALVTCLRALKACKKAKAAPKVEDGPEDGPTDSDGPEDGPEDVPEDVHPLDRGHALAQGLAGLAQGLMMELRGGTAELSPEDRTGLIASLAALSKDVKAA